MVVTGNGIEQALGDRVFRSMFEERKRVFVDLLGWDIPILAGRYEIDQFDDDEAVYIVITDDSGEHCGSARLLRTDRPHILDTIFPHLCEDGPPTGPAVREITRFCLARPVARARPPRHPKSPHIRSCSACAASRHHGLYWRRRVGMVPTNSRPRLGMRSAGAAERQRSPQLIGDADRYFTGDASPPPPIRHVRADPSDGSGSCGRLRHRRSRHAYQLEICDTRFRCPAAVLRGAVERRLLRHTRSQATGRSRVAR